ncbi:MAG: L-threonylcarbamoyladenylate synthase [Bdellovibrionaceae bacterium]|nr:L-threonylcarbamoyladenylate synthase [Pseudobdellovibrionaceae bacterium]
MKSIVNYEQALKLLKAGKLVALPTETVYGLAGRIDDEKALKKIFQLKKRPFFDPLIVHCYDKKQALSYLSEKQPLIEKIFDEFTPGPLTLVAKKNNKISSLITAKKQTVAIRIPKHPLIKKILKQLAVPLAMPSANPYGKVSPVKSQHVLSSFKNQIPVLEGGFCQKGLESTILKIDFLKKKLLILRPGIITKENLEKFLIKYQIGFKVKYKKDPFQPGGGTSHYKPDSAFYIIESEKTEKEIKSFISKKFPKKILKKLNLSLSSQKTAREVYSQLRELSKNKKSIIYVQKKSHQKSGLWDTIWNRLEKASSGYFKFF